MLGSEKWEMLINSSPDFIFVSRIDTFAFIEASKRACIHYGYTRKELLTMQIFDIEINASLVSILQNYYNNTIVGEVFEIFGHNKCKDGTIFPAHSRYTKIDNKYAMACVRDITNIEEQANLEIISNQLIAKNSKIVIDQYKLSKRESEVLLLIGKAMSNAHIAKKLSINTKTVSTYRTRLLQKLGLQNNTQLTQYAVKII